MIIYLDVLIIVNAIVDYFIILATLKLLKTKVKTFKILISVVIGGLSSIYILADLKNIFLDFLYKFLITVLMVFILFGFKNFKIIAKGTIILFLVSCAYTGAVLAVYLAFKPINLYITNSVVYFNISPLILVISTVFGYFVFMLGCYIFKNKSSNAKTYYITINILEYTVSFVALSDTGNSVTDCFGNNEIIIVNDNVFNKIDKYVRNKSNEYEKRYRAVPCSTVTGEALLYGYRCDSARIQIDKMIKELICPIIIKSNTKLPKDFEAIINPEIVL